jgi:hypothetical protein
MLYPVRWLHEQGHTYLQAVLAVTKITIRPEAGVFLVEYGVWENTRAFEVHSEALHKAMFELPIEGFFSIQELLDESAAIIINHEPNVTSTEDNNE